jgi:hypothetical protein
MLFSLICDITPEPKEKILANTSASAFAEATSPCFGCLFLIDMKLMAKEVIVANPMAV